MQSQNIKHNSAGKVGSISCLLLTLLAFLALNPVANSSAFADEIDEEYGGNAADFDGASKGSADNADNSSTDDAPNYGIETYGATASTVTISFSPSSATGSITPVDTTNGDKAKVDVQATVKVQNSGGYSVYVGSSSSQLKNGTNVIDSVSSASTYANLPLNRWGFSFRKASSSTDKTVADSYVAMPATLRSSPLDSNTSTKILSDTRYYMLSFAARISADQPAGTYTNSVTMSVVSSPVQLVLSDITEMQQMTTDICENTSSGAAKQLKDTRDGKFYWVGKLPDGKCWMTQNLDLDLTNGTVLSSTETDLGWTGSTYPTTAKTWNPPYSTTTDSTVILADNTGTRSWSLGDYYIAYPNDATSCGSKIGDTGTALSACKASNTAGAPNMFAALSTPTSANGDVKAHYLLGNYYQWNAATAGTGGTITSGQASDSICPRNWRLPTSDTGGEFQVLMNTCGVTSGAATTGDTAKLVGAPLYFVRGGRVIQDADLLLRGTGQNGLYWSSTPKSSAANAYNLYFANDVTPSNDSNRQNGFSVRCVAR